MCPSCVSHLCLSAILTDLTSVICPSPVLCLPPPVSFCPSVFSIWFTGIRLQAIEIVRLIDFYK